MCGQVDATKGLNGSTHTPPLKIKLRFGHNCDTNPGPILEREKIPIGFRNLTFQEIVEAHKILLRQGLNIYGSRKESDENNLHNAQLALWNTIVSGVSYREFRRRFFKEMRKAIRNDNYGLSYFERTALRLDNPRNNWHSAIPDPKTSLNLGLMARPLGKRSHYRIKERVDPRIARREARRRHRALLRARTEAFWEANGERLEQQKRERIEASQSFHQLMFDHMTSISKAAVEQPFLLKPSMVIRVLSLRAKINASYQVLRPRPGDIRTIRLLMGRVSPAIQENVKPFSPQPLDGEEYKKAKAGIDLLKDGYSDDFNGTFTHVTNYLDALNSLVTLDTAIPLEIRSDIEKLVKQVTKHGNSRQRPYDTEEDVEF